VDASEAAAPAPAAPGTHGPQRSRTRFALTAVYEPDSGGWIRGQLLELPGVITAAPNLKEARSSIRDALAEYLAASEPIAPSAVAEVEELVLEIVDGEQLDRS
jgi:predicted RNase H-like HicB family nuclease